MKQSEYVELGLWPWVEEAMESARTGLQAIPGFGPLLWPTYLPREVGEAAKRRTIEVPIFEDKAIVEIAPPMAREIAIEETKPWYVKQVEIRNVICPYCAAILKARGIWVPQATTSWVDCLHCGRRFSIGPNTHPRNWMLQSIAKIPKVGEWPLWVKIAIGAGIVVAGATVVSRVMKKVGI